MTTPQITLKGPAGYCRTCRRTVTLALPHLPAVARNGRIVSGGNCPGCGGRVSSFYSVSPLADLPRQGLSPLVVAVAGAALKAGYEAAAAEARKLRADMMLRLQREAKLPHGAIARVFGLSRGQVAAALALARSRQVSGEAGPTDGQKCRGVFHP